jgi:hypothetical protein
MRSTRMNFAIDSSTPSPGGSAPPDRPVPGAARHHRDLHGVAGLQHALHLLFGLRQRHYHRQLPVGGQAVALVGPGVLFLEQHRARRQERAQRRGYFPLPAR